MQKLKLTLIPLCIGVILLFFSWYVSYPISIDSPYDFTYNHISPLYWASLTILFISFFVIAMNTRNNILRWIVTFSTILLMYSSSYFYYMVGASDSHSFRGLTEYFISTGDLTPTRHHEYYQWPLFFTLNEMATSITGLDLRCFEFVFYGVIGFLLATSLYLYASKAGANGYAAVVPFFIVMFYFFNYQWAPFSVSATLLILTFVLDGYAPRKRAATIATLIIILSVTLTHAFVPVFFIIYYLIMYVLSKNRRYLSLFMFTAILYAAVLVHYSTTFFVDLTEQLSRVFTLEYYGRVTATLADSVAPRPYIDIVAQIFSRIAIISTTVVTGLGFIILLLRRKLRKNDYAILLTGISYIAVGSVLGILGTRAFFLVTIPASLGACYVLESRFKKYVKPIFLSLLILFTLVLVHATFYDTQIFFQTREEYECANFVIENYNWTNPSRLLSHFRLSQYLRSFSEIAVFPTDFDPDFPQDVRNSDCVVYTVGLGKSFLRLDYPVERSLSEFRSNDFNLIYDSGNFSYIFLRVSKDG